MIEIRGNITEEPDGHQMVLSGEDNELTRSGSSGPDTQALECWGLLVQGTGPKVGAGAPATRSDTQGLEPRKDAGDSRKRCGERCSHQAAPNTTPGTSDQLEGVEVAD